MTARCCARNAGCVSSATSLSLVLSFFGKKERTFDKIIYKKNLNTSAAKIRLANIFTGG